QISGLVTNTGHGVIFRVSDTLAPGLAVNISGGPLSYQYRVHELHIHYGRSDDRGSEHTVAGKPFPAEVRTGGPRSAPPQSRRTERRKGRKERRIGRVVSPSING
ncbi:unnamed protein product, partial [Ixodes pacificus]